MIFAGRTVVDRTPRGQQQVIKYVNKDCYVLVLPSGLSCVVMTDDTYPEQVNNIFIYLDKHYRFNSFLKFTRIIILIILIGSIWVGEEMCESICNQTTRTKLG